MTVSQQVWMKMNLKNWRETVNTSSKERYGNLMSTIDENEIKKRKENVSHSNQKVMTVLQQVWMKMK